jgi:hypothetical protein
MLRLRGTEPAGGTDRERITKRERRGLPNGGGATKGKAPSCDDCYFRRNLLCSLELDAPCTTFRPDRPEGLVPPRQPVLLMRAPRWASEPGPAGV